MSDKTLGQVAYEAWRERNMPKHPNHLGQYVTPNEWDHVDQRTRDDMQAAAEAVVMATTVDAVLLPQGRAVIEAAKACIKNRLDADKFTPSWWQLKRAVEALQEVE